MTDSQTVRTVQHSVYAFVSHILIHFERERENILNALSVTHWMRFFFAQNITQCDDVLMVEDNSVKNLGK